MESVYVTKPAPGETRRWYDDACGAALGMELVGERWSILIVRELLLGCRRFGELRTGLPGISANILAQRLSGLEAAGIVRRDRLPPPANVQVYELTQWGYQAEEAVLALAKWALRSPLHDHRLPFSAVSLMLSLRMLFVAERAVGMTMAIAFYLGSERYWATLTDGGLAVGRGSITRPTATLFGTPSCFLAPTFGGMPLAAAEAQGAVRVEGDAEAAARFFTLFSLPSKIA
jgi:DNA-binding HxlR family transcriptional regulator